MGPGRGLCAFRLSHAGCDTPTAIAPPPAAPEEKKTMYMYKVGDFVRYNGAHAMERGKVFCLVKAEGNIVRLRGVKGDPSYACVVDFVAPVAPNDFRPGDFVRIREVDSHHKNKHIGTIRRIKNVENRGNPSMTTAGFEGDTPFPSEDFLGSLFLSRLDHVGCDVE